MSKETEPQEKHFELLAAIIDLTDEKGFVPSIRELAGALKINSTSVINNRLIDLERFGFIERGKGPKGQALSRAITITMEPHPLGYPSVLYDSQSLENSEATKSPIEQEGGSDHNGSKK